MACEKVRTQKKPATGKHPFVGILCLQKDMLPMMLYIFGTTCMKGSIIKTFKIDTQTQMGISQECQEELTFDFSNLCWVGGGKCGPTNSEMKDIIGLSAKA